MDVRLELRDVADLQEPARFRHDLHDADGTDRAPRVLVEPGLLIALRSHQQEIDVVTVAVLPQESADRQERLASPYGRSDLRVARAGEHVAVDHVSEGGPDPVLPD